jgi:hypothetical protein
MWCATLQVFDTVCWTLISGVICVELMKKGQDTGFRLTETLVHHFPLCVLTGFCLNNAEHPCNRASP